MGDIRKACMVLMLPFSAKGNVSLIQPFRFFGILFFLKWKANFSSINHPSTHDLFHITRGWWRTQEAVLNWKWPLRIRSLSPQPSTSPLIKMNLSVSIGLSNWENTIKCTLKLAWLYPRGAKQSLVGPWNEGGPPKLSVGIASYLHQTGIQFKG